MACRDALSKELMLCFRPRQQWSQCSTDELSELLLIRYAFGFGLIFVSHLETFY